VGLLAVRRPLRNSDGVNKTVTELTDRLISSYARVGGINHLDGVNLPSKSAIAAITEDLLKLLFPGFFHEKPLHAFEIKMETANLMDSVLGRLEEEMEKSLKIRPEFEKGGRDARVSARGRTADFLGGLDQIREILQTDVEAAFLGDPAALNREEIIVAYPFVEAIAVQRMAHALYLNEVPLIPRIMTEWAHSRSGMDLHPGAQIGSHFFVDHCTGTVVGETAIIGNHVKMYQGVGLVARSLAGGQSLRGQKRHPTIEDHVTVYAGATIVGGETVIGAGTTVGANVFLMHSVPANSLVLQEDVSVKVLHKRDRAQTRADFEI
jgi:serine O-acetyltransferase